MKLKRSLIINKRNGQASITIPSKFIKRLDNLPKKVLIEIDNSVKVKGVKPMKLG